jgi:predicted nuclease of predicted toxin-antitoxin system
LRLKLDDNLGEATAQRLRQAGHEVARVADQAMLGATDAELFEACVAEARALVTLDLDFANTLRFDPTAGTGIVVLRVTDRPGRKQLALVVEQLIAGLARADLGGRLWVVDTTRVREYQPPTD